MSVPEANARSDQSEPPVCDCGMPPYRYDEVLTVDTVGTPAAARALADAASAGRGRRVLVRYRDVTGVWVDPWEGEG